MSLVLNRLFLYRILSDLSSCQHRQREQGHQKCWQLKNGISRVHPQAVEVNIVHNCRSCERRENEDGLVKPCKQENEIQHGLFLDQEGCDQYGSGEN